MQFRVEPRTSRRFWLFFRSKIWLLRIVVHGLNNNFYFGGKKFFLETMVEFLKCHFHVFLRYRRHKFILEKFFYVKIFFKNFIYKGKNMRKIDRRHFWTEKIMSRYVIFEKIAIFHVFWPKIIFLLHNIVSKLKIFIKFVFLVKFWTKMTYWSTYFDLSMKSYNHFTALMS